MTHCKWYDYKHAHTTYTKQLTNNRQDKKKHKKETNTNKKQNKTKQQQQKQATPRQRDRQRDRDRQTETERQTERQTQRDTDRDIDKQTYRDSDRETQKETERDRDRQVKQNYTIHYILAVETGTNTLQIPFSTLCCILQNIYFLFGSGHDSHETLSTYEKRKQENKLVLIHRLGLFSL